VLPNKIKILPESLTNRIAAGEVVERPASVIKELVENSLDAGSTEITVIIKEGGTNLIQVVDNGTGLSRDDALLAFQRHTTSKIASDEDLENIRTFGFRGEALSSIASVARVEVKTAQADAPENTLLRLEGGVVTDIQDVGTPPGTSIAVKNLFFNTPARRKFLRSVISEYRQILETMKRFFLAAPQVAFQFINEGEIIYELKPASLERRIAAVFGDRFQEHLIKVADRTELLEISGFVGDWDLFRKSRGQQFLFLNNRFIIDRSLNHAITAAFGPTLPHGEFPFYSIFLAIEPNHMDVNVHPTKMEVKFAEERLIYSLLRTTVARAMNSDVIIPHTGKNADTSGLTAPDFPDPQTELNFQPSGFEFTTPPAPAASPTPEDFIRREWAARLIPPAPQRPPEIQPQSPAPGMPDPRPARPLVWQLHQKYIVTQIKSGLIIVDQHVAHERILFERAMSDFEKKAPDSQQLLFPEVIELAPEDHSYFLEILPFLERIGYTIKTFSGRSFSIEAVPAGVKHAGDEKVLLEILDEYKKSRGEQYDIREKVATSFSCKTAIKAGEKLMPEEMLSLIEQLFKTKTPYFCPHGRPVIINISLEELDRRFGRIK